MKKNGFIATSVLYSFFLVFITLFLGLVMNYLHNRVLLRRIEKESWDTLVGINNTKITDLKVGDYIQFAVNPSQGLLNGSANWIVAYIETSGNNKTYYFLSDLSAHNIDIYYQLSTDLIIKWHPSTIDVYADLARNGAYTGAFVFPNISVSVPTTSLMSKIRNQDVADIIKNAIFGVDGDYIVYVDEETSGYTKDKYYEYRTYTFNQANQAILDKYCHATFNGSTLAYNADNPFGYANIVGESVTNVRYVNYCSYANPVAYTLPASDHVVSFDENNTHGDLITNTNSSVYTLRLMAKVTADVNATNTYISGGKGTRVDPYLLTNGGKP